MQLSIRHIAPFAAVTLMASNALASEAAAFPQLDTSSFPNQVAWLVITFIAMYLVIAKSVMPSVSQVLSAREATIADAIAKAEAYKATAESTKGDFEAGSQKSRAKAAETMAKAQADVAKKQADALAALNVELEKQTAKSQAAIAKAVKEATKDMDAASADLARAIAEKLLGGKVDEASLKAALKKAA